MERPILIVALISLGACRLDPGEPQYPVYAPFQAADFLPGPFPYLQGDERLSLGVFYEGDASEVIEIDGVSTNYFIFESTYTQGLSDDRVEGLHSDEIEISNAQLWWGGGIIWEPARDLTGWTTVHVSLQATDALFETMEIGIQSGGGDQVVNPTAYGFAADGEWHSLVIPIADLGGANLASVTSPLLMLNTQGTTDSTLLVDDFYFTKE